MIVSDSTPLIYLAKLGHLSLLHKLFGEVFVPSEVMSEVARGKQLGFNDAAVVERAKEDGWIKEVGLNSPQRRELLKLRHTFSDISVADAAAIALAQSLDANLCLDDSRAVKVAEVLNKRHIGTLGILLLAVKKRPLTKEQARKSVLMLPERGFYVGHDLLAEFMKLLDAQPR